jgi:branched-chain amino acid transport system permease protein
MMILSQLVISGLATGMLYALIALSMTVGYRATTVVNFGHGDMVMIGAYTMLVLVTVAGLPFPLALAITAAALFGFGFLTQRGMLSPIMTGPHLSLAIMTIAIGYALRGIARTQWGNDTLLLPRPYPQNVFLLGPVVITTDDLAIAGSVLVLLVILFLVFNVTRIGKVIQATFQTQRGAQLVGINVPSFHGMMWGTGATLGTAGGVLLALIVPLTPDVGVWTLMRGFAAMTLGGFGSLHGAVIGGLLLGLMEKLLGFYVSTAFIDISAYLVCILVLLIRPRGLFGKAATLRV